MRSQRPKHTQPRSGKGRSDDAPVWLYGRHAVAAALGNPARHQHKLLATKNALDWLAEKEDRRIPIEPVAPDVLDNALPAGAVHQGLAMLANPLAPTALADVLSQTGPCALLVLDQVTDPQNIGALFRVAAAFGMAGLVAQDRRTPPLGGALAKAAAGAVDQLPFIPVVNIARALNEMSDAGFTSIGLAGDGAEPIGAFAGTERYALVAGAEGKGLRPAVREACSTVAAIPLSPTVESLNVATAAAVAAYAVKHGQPG